MFNKRESIDAKAAAITFPHMITSDEMRTPRALKHILQSIAKKNEGSERPEEKCFRIQVDGGYLKGVETKGVISISFKKTRSFQHDRAVLVIIHGEKKEERNFMQMKDTAFAQLLFKLLQDKQQIIIEEHPIEG